MNSLNGELERTIKDCFKEINNHTLQSAVISPHIENINHNLENVLSLIENINDNSPVTEKRGNFEKRVAEPLENEALLKISYAISRFDYQIIIDILKSEFSQKETFYYLTEKLNIKSSLINEYMMKSDFSQAEVLNYLAEKLNTDTSVLKNHIDMFKSYSEQEERNTSGWDQKKLFSEFKTVKDKYDTKSYDVVKAEIEAILWCLMP